MSLARGSHCDGEFAIEIKSNYYNIVLLTYDKVQTLDFI